MSRPTTPRRRQPDVARDPRVTVTDIAGTHELTITSPEAVADYIAEAAGHRSP